MSAPNRLRGLAAGVALVVSAGAAQADFIDSWVDGFYAEPGFENRRGLGLQYIPTGPEAGILFAAYYTYDEETGEPTWIQGASGVEAGQFEVEIRMELTGGGSFGAQTGNPVTVDNAFASAKITMNSCSNFDFEITSSNVANFDNGFVSTLDIVDGVPNSQCVYQEEFDGCPAFATPGADPRTCVISSGVYTDDWTLTNDTLWVLNGGVYFGALDNPDNTNTLTIEPGTRIIGLPNSLLNIQRGARIMAEGVAHAPIVMTGPNTASNSTTPGATADWGGLSLNGRAPLNTCDNPGQCTAEGEGETGTYGGDDPFDSSGVLRYLRVQFAGFRFNDEDELNGIAFQGVGAGTVVENIQVHANEDDGVEFYGGTVNVRNLVLTDIKDDSVDWTQGWQGRLQNVLVVQNRDFDAIEVADFGIEADSLEGNNDAQPRAKPWIANATFIGRPETNGANFRRGTGVNMTNSIIIGFDTCLDINDPATFTAAGTPGNPTGVMTFQNTILDCTTNFVEEGGDPWSIEDFFFSFDGNSTDDPMLDGVFPPEGADYLSGADIDYTIFDSFFNNYGHIGAFSNKTTAWTHGWTLQEMEFDY